MLQSTEISSSESLRTGLLLAASGGLMDAYSFLCRGEVFANAQTGNILLLAVNLVRMNFGECLLYFFPIASFIAGIAVSELAQSRIKYFELFHWRQLTLLIEAAILTSVAFLSQDMNLLANCLISFACGIQVESFRKIEGSAVATTMCIGNLRSSVQNFGEYLRTKEHMRLKQGTTYMLIILCFALGAVLGSCLIPFLGEKAILCSTCLLLLALSMM